MGDKQRRLKDKASRYYADGKLKDALKLYLRVVEEDPTELQVQLKVGDIYKRLDNVDAAVTAYAPVARAYANDGMLLKAIAVCKMVLAVDSDHGPTREMLTELSAKRRGPPRSAAPLATAPVTLEGMGISPAPGAGPALGDYGMVEFASAPADPAVAGDAATQLGAMRMVDPSELGESPPAVITGRPVSPPHPNTTPRVSWPAAAGATPPPQVAWPQAGATPSNPPTWPQAPGAPDTSVSWPTAPATQPAAEAPKIVVGSRLDEASPDISITEEAGPDRTAAPLGQAPAPTPGDRSEVLAERAAREVEAAMAEFGLDEDPDADEPIVHVLEMESGTSVDLDLAVAEAVADVEVSDDDGSEDEDLELPEADDEPVVSAESNPIDLTDVVTSRDLAPAVELSGRSEDIDAGALEDDGGLDRLGQTQIPLFSELPKNAFIELLVHMEMRTPDAEDVIIQEGDVGDSFFVLVSGKVRVQRRDESGQDVVLAYLAEGAFFGEMALLQDGARTATVIAEVESQLFEISKEVLDRVVSRYPSVANVLRNFYRQRLLSTTMATHPIFRPFSIDERRGLMELFKSRSFKKGDSLVVQGKKGTGLFLLLYGTVEVVADRESGAPKMLAELSSGEVFGEMSLLTGKPTMATVRAITDCFVLRLAKKQFDELIMTHPQILELVSVISDEREGLNALILSQRGGPQTGALLV